MKKYVTPQSIAMLTRMAVFCLLATVLDASFSPGFAGVLSRSADIRAMLPTVLSMIGPLRSIKVRLPPFGACSRFSMDQIFSLL